MAAVVRRRASRTHRNALTRFLRTTGLANVPEEAMLIAYLRDLAKLMDEEPGTRVMQLYLSAQKDARRVLNGGVVAKKPAQKKTTTAAEPETDKEPPVNELADFKNRRGIAS